MYEHDGPSNTMFSPEQLLSDRGSSVSSRSLFMGANERGGNGLPARYRLIHANNFGEQMTVASDSVRFITNDF